MPACPLSSMSVPPFPLLLPVQALDASNYLYPKLNLSQQCNSFFRSPRLLLLWQEPSAVSPGSPQIRGSCSPRLRLASHPFLRPTRTPFQSTLSLSLEVIASGSPSLWPPQVWVRWTFSFYVLKLHICCHLMEDEKIIICISMILYWKSTELACRKLRV